LSSVTAAAAAAQQMLMDMHANAVSPPTTPTESGETFCGGRRWCAATEACAGSARAVQHRDRQTPNADVVNR